MLMQNMATFLIKQMVILTSFYAQVYPKTETVIKERNGEVLTQYVYFTQLCLILTTIFLILSFLDDYHFNKFYLFCLPNLIVWNLLIISVYWFLYFFKKDLILSKIMQLPENYSLFIDLCQHLFPLIGLFICFCENDLKISYLNHLLNLGLAIFYAFVIFINFKYKNKFPYGFMTALGMKGTLLIFIPSVVMVFSFILYGIILMNKKGRKWVHEK